MLALLHPNCVGNARQYTTLYSNGRGLRIYAQVFFAYLRRKAQPMRYIEEHFPQKIGGKDQAEKVKLLAFEYISAFRLVEAQYHGASIRKPIAIKYN